MATFITPEGIASLAQLNYLRLQNFDNKLAWREIDVDLRGPYDARVQQRYENRDTSMQQLEHGTRRSETRSRPLAMEIVPREFLAAERGAQKVVLEGLEADVREEKIFFELSNKGHRFSTVATSRKQQLVNWDPDTVRSMGALRLVLKFRGKAHALRTARVTATMQRATQPDFPPELLIQVLEHNLLPQRKLFRWRVDHASSLEEATGETLAWPQDTAQHTRIRLSQAAEVPFLTSAIVELPGAVLFPNPKAPLTITKALVCNEHRIRHLVLDLELPIIAKPSPSHHFQYSQGLQALDQRLTHLSTSMPDLTRHFSALTTCVVSILLDDTHALIPFSADQDGRAQHITFRDNHALEDLRPTIVALLVAFAKTGPGKRKFVKFTFQGKRLAATGDLLELKCDEASEALQGLSVAGSAGANGQDSSSLVSEADRIFDGAFAQSRSVGVRSVV